MIEKNIHNDREKKEIMIMKKIMIEKKKEIMIVK